MTNPELKNVLKISISDPETCLKKMDVTISSDSVEHEMNSITAEFANIAQLPGFRPGKAPLLLVKNRFQPKIKEEMIRRFYSAALERAAEEEQMDILSYLVPDKEKPELQTGKDYNFSIDFNVAPEIKLPEYKGIKAEAPEATVSEQDIRKQIDSYCEMYAEFLTIDGIAKKGDMLKISYSSDFQIPENASANLKLLLEAAETWAWLNDPEIIPGIIKTLTGASAGKEYELSAEYPEDYREKTLAGKIIKYTIKVLEVQRRTPIKSDEELCKKLKLNDIKTLHEQIRASLENEAKRKKEAELGKEIVDKICSKVDKFPLPQAILTDATQKEFRRIAARHVRSKEDVEQFTKDKDKYLEEAKKIAEERLFHFFIFRKIAKNEKIVIEKKEIDSHIEGMSKVYGVKEKKLREQIEYSGGLEDLQMDMITAKVTDFLVKNAEITGRESKTD